jgi:hypothetical protein
MGAIRSLMLAASHPERVRGLAFIAPSLRLTPLPPERAMSFTDRWRPTRAGRSSTAHYWRRDYRGFLEFFFARMFTEPHSTKQIEDCVGWGLETDPETLIATVLAPKPDRATAGAVRARALSGAGRPRRGGRISPSTRGVALAEATGGTLVLLDGPATARTRATREGEPAAARLRRWRSRHAAGAGTVSERWSAACSPPSARALHLLADRPRPRAARRRHRARAAAAGAGAGDRLAGAAPGHARAGGGGRAVHPASALLASESRHIECESAEHDLHCFQAWRRMDEILVANFMVFHDLVRESRTTCGSATRRGSSTTTCTRTRSRSARRTSG